MPKKATTKKPPAKKSTTKKASSAKKPATKKGSSAKKPAAKKTTTKKAPAKKTAPKKTGSSTAKKSASGKASKKGESYISKAPIRRLMKEKGANLVAAEAVDKLIEFLEKTAINTTKKALNICEADKRKRIMAGDIHKATLRMIHA
ncbi:MAG: hypothetical protein EU547_01310 [Promethearchaeota archaeon]|nr:MAG: hypothetical protein EU547_01310 [Candidatus Lokiarchaeota archaeon]